MLCYLSFNVKLMDLIVVLFFSDLYFNDICVFLWGCVCLVFQMISGGICFMGYYCLVGFFQFLVCILGMYCEILGLFLFIGVDLDNFIMFNLYFIFDILN